MSAADAATDTRAGDGRAVLRTEHLTREVQGRRVVDDVTVDVEEGTVVAIVGPSGSGKSSLLRLLNRLDEPTGGTVLLDGRDYRELPPRELRRRVGLVMQAPQLFPGTVAHNVRFGPAQRGERLPDETVADLLADVGLASFGGRDGQTLSGGERQRVALARAVANGSRVLLLDEPTSALDDTAKRGVEELVRTIVHARRLTCLVVTHDLDQAARIADTAIVLEGGRLTRSGTLQEVLGDRGAG